MEMTVWPDSDGQGCVESGKSSSISISGSTGYRLNGALIPVDITQTHRPVYWEQRAVSRTGFAQGGTAQMLSFAQLHGLYVAILGPILDQLPPELAELIVVTIHGGPVG
jgi:hypothetical protein